MRKNTNWKVEQPLKKDAESLASMHASVFKETYSREGDLRRNEDVDAYSHNYVSQAGLERRRALIERTANSEEEFLRVVKLGSKGIAWFAYGFQNENIQELVALYVASKGQGIGMTLTSEFIEWCDGEEPIDVGVDESNTSAKLFYKRMGFQAVAGSRRAFEDIHNMHEITMRRSAEVSRQ